MHRVAAARHHHAAPVHHRGPRAGAGDGPVWIQRAAMHMTQYRSASLPDGLPYRGNMECGPTAALMAVRALGLDLPGLSGARTQAAIDAARRAGTGNTENVSTGTQDLVGIGTAAHAAVHTTSSITDAEAAVRAGGTAVISGDSSAAHIWSSPYIDPRYLGKHTGHWIAITGYDAQIGEYLVDDPVMTATVHVPASMLQTFHEADPADRQWGDALIFTRVDRVTAVAGAGGAGAPARARRH